MAFCEEVRQKPECRRLDLEGYLIKPLQRICRYPLLLKEILKVSYFLSLSQLFLIYEIYQLFMLQSSCLMIAFALLITCDQDMRKHPDKAALEQAISRIEAVVRDVNEAKRMAEHLSQVVEIQNSMEFPEGKVLPRCRASAPAVDLRGELTPG